ncbi:hypothetical protein [Enterococcus mundtii]|uniref:hypothetical protein n=1 Tax=Enterococcus mundtii TaxID=53346 RepID=UPI001377B44C|nr:hypothetical protein [Enterococcus mundtii]NBA63730.1 hypothetical protein [Enterococcus mundtii]
MKPFSPRLILQRAITVRLIDGSIWANLGNGKFVHQTNLTVKEIEVLYPKIKTVVESGIKIMAKKKHSAQSLVMLEPPMKVKDLTWLKPLSERHSCL